MAHPLLEVKHLSASYGLANVLDDVNLVVDKGQVITVIGPNGAGKSTLLNALMGLIPSQAAIHFDGQPISHLSLEERVAQGIALVPEKRELFSTMSVEENLELGGYRQKQLGVKNWRSHMDHVYELFPRLRERASQLAGTLSGGERQMLAIGRALMSAPKLLMLDEPSIGLAPLVVKEIFNIIERLKESSVTIILVEQNARSALSVASYGYVLEMGQIRAEGAARELAQNPRLIETYLGSSER
jgi:branched-chain amino acid transport system ATP-binding protein